MNWWMSEYLRFAAETRHAVEIGCEGLMDDFDRHFAAKFGFLGPSPGDASGWRLHGDVPARVNQIFDNTDNKES